MNFFFAGPIELDLLNCEPSIFTSTCMIGHGAALAVLLAAVLFVYAILMLLLKHTGTVKHIGKKKYWIGYILLVAAILCLVAVAPLLFVRT